MDTASISKFDYHLPIEQIANKPLPRRDYSKLMYLDTTSSNLRNSTFSDIIDFVQKGDLLVLNDTKVIPGRISLKKETGGAVEILFHRPISKNIFEAIFSSSRPLKINSKLFYKNKNFFRVLSTRENYVTLVEESNKSIMDILKKIGIIPLPKYIKRPVTDQDKRRYQTVYASKHGSVAAPTAGLHFTKKTINKLIDKGVKINYLTLHVTYNTFRPIDNDDYNKHKIGKEFFMVNKLLFDNIKNAKLKNKKVIAVGTTVARTLEHCFSKNITTDFQGYTDLFIKPGYDFKIIDSLLTNFHLPKSSLLLLVCAFAGKDKILKAYKYAVANNYRVYSYGDCMFINKS